jgi:hypothetical protein
MDIQTVWQRPKPLMSGEKPDQIYSLAEGDALPDTPGVYVFARAHGAKVFPLYIGKALNLRRRVEQQLNNVKLMLSLQKAQTGRRVLLVGELVPKGGQVVGKVLRIAETALIRAALAEGHDILNVQGTNYLVHTVECKGNRNARLWLPGGTLKMERL